MARPRWYLDELANAGPEHLDGAYVAGYDRNAGTAGPGGRPTVRSGRVTVRMLNWRSR